MLTSGRAGGVGSCKLASADAAQGGEANTLRFHLSPHSAISLADGDRNIVMTRFVSAYIDLVPDLLDAANDVAREALAAAITHLGRPLTGSEIWVIGDTPHDISCARAIGARVLAVATGWHSISELEACHPDALFADLADTDRTLKLFQEG